VYQILYFAGIPVGLYAFIHATLQRADAFTAADKLTKPKWLGISGAGAAALVLSFGFGILWLVGLVAALVYIVDVKPAVTEVQGGSRW
jgi:hypothetical protein